MAASPLPVNKPAGKEDEFCEQDLVEFCNDSGVTLTLLPLSSGCPSGIYLIQNGHPSFVIRDDLHGALRLCVASHLIAAFRQHTPGKFTTLAARHGTIVLAEVQTETEPQERRSLECLENLPMAATPAMHVIVHYFEELFT